MQVFGFTMKVHDRTFNCFFFFETKHHAKGRGNCAWKCFRRRFSSRKISQILEFEVNVLDENFEAAKSQADKIQRKKLTNDKYLLIYY